MHKSRIIHNKTSCSERAEDTWWNHVFATMQPGINQLHGTVYAPGFCSWALPVSGLVNEINLYHYVFDVIYAAVGRIITRESRDHHEGIVIITRELVIITRENKCCSTPPQLKT